MMICLVLSLGIFSEGLQSFGSLSVAIGKGDIGKIKKLVAEKNSVNSQTNGGQNMLTWAFWYPYPNTTIWSDTLLVRLTNEEREDKIGCIKK